MYITCAAVFVTHHTIVLNNSVFLNGYYTIPHYLNEWIGGGGGGMRKHQIPMRF
ncbi:MAG: hypothetical protein ACI8RD_002313, partial [Bacillariaceae sp.]